MTILLLPGYGGSGPQHWQSLWQAADPAISRFQPGDWDKPNLSDWLAALERAVEEAGGPVWLVAHSLACLLVAHAAPRLTDRVRGAFMVAVPNPDGPVFPAEAASFAPVPRAALPWPALIVASSDDPYGTLEYSRSCAADWGAGLVVAGALGHINGASNLGHWPQGAGLFAAFRAGGGQGFPAASA